MIITKEIEIKLNKFNIRYYKRIGYYTDKSIIMVKIEDIGRVSMLKVDVECDFCGKIKKISYRKYLDNISKHNLYACSNKCAVIKGEMTCLEKYGTKYALQNENIKENLINYFLDTYGVDNTSKLQSNKDKREDTMMKRFGVKTNIILPETHKKAVESSLTPESIERRKNTMIENLGVDNPMKSEQVKDKFKNTNLEKYGEEYPMRNQKIRDKLKNSIMEKYGVNHVMCVPEIALKAGSASLKSKIERGISIDKSDITEWSNYKNEVKKLTHRNKKELYNNWDGFDYYDGEDIRENLMLDHIDENYPCVDHKISIFNGFKDSISVNDISNINNLCITKRILNSNKSRNNEEFFKNKKDEN